MLERPSLRAEYGGSEPLDIVVSAQLSYLERGGGVDWKWSIITWPLINPSQSSLKTSAWPKFRRASLIVIHIPRTLPETQKLGIWVPTISGITVGLLFWPVLICILTLKTIIINTALSGVL